MMISLLSKTCLIVMLTLLQVACVLPSLTNKANGPAEISNHARLTYYTHSYVLVDCTELDGLTLPCQQSLKHKSALLKFQGRDYTVTIFGGKNNTNNTTDIAQFIRDEGVQLNRIFIKTEAPPSDGYIQITEFIPVTQLPSCQNKLGEYQIGCSVAQNRALMFKNPIEIVSQPSTDAAAFERPGEQIQKANGGGQ